MDTEVEPLATTYIPRSTDRCVACGLCLPVCPSYQLAATEEVTPRGRIALMRGLREGQLPLDEAIREDLQSCLQCQACARVCPSEVPYGELIAGTRAYLHETDASRVRRGVLAAAAWALNARWAQAVSLGLGLAARRFGAARLLRLVPGRTAAGLARLIQTVPESSRLASRLPRPPTPRRQTPEAPPVSLFVGCLAGLADAGTHRSAIRLLEAAGCRVVVPAEQGCCGALHFHQGDQARARRMAERLERVFATDGPILFAASGCGAHLQDYGALYGRAGQAFADRVEDLGVYLNRILERRPIPLRPRHGTVWVHTPCTQQNALGDTGNYPRLLARIPGLTVRHLPGDDLCCGSAGSHLLTHPKAANQLGERTLSHIPELGPEDRVVTTNVGCALHLNRLLRSRGAQNRMIHPVELLAEQLDPAE